MEPLLLWRSIKYCIDLLLACVRILSYPACIARVPCYIVICGQSGCISYTLCHKRYDFQKKSYRTWNSYFDFLYNFCL